MIIDDVKIKITAGHGGRGLVVFNKTKMSLGPTGGSGGNGGNIFLQGVSDLGALRQFRFKKDIKAEDGGNGKNQLHDGNDAEDLILLVPVGTVSHNLTTGKDFEITKIGQLEQVAKGGRGGKGNFLFRSAINTSPKQFEEGKNGESFELRLELKMIADVGFVGLPNVGKSSLLNELTAAKSKVANYPFTTLNPNLGVYYDLILADIPGLVEGASTGKGLGIKFLRHIERTKVLFHFVSADSLDSVGDYNTVRNELAKYNKLLLEKNEYIFLSKSDTVSPDVILKTVKEFSRLKRDPAVAGEKSGKKIVPISIIDLESIENVKKILNDLISEKTVI